MTGQQITTVAELDALPVTSAVLWRHNGRMWQKWDTVGGTGWFTGQKLMQPAASVAKYPVDILFRPDQPRREATQPTKERLVALFREHDFERMECHDHGGLCDQAGCHDLREDQAQHYASAVLALYGSQPTVQQVRDEWLAGFWITTAIQDVAAERASHEQRGWTAEHDAEHGSGHLIDLALSRLMLARAATVASPEDLRSPLVKAAALVVAAIEQFDRSGADRCSFCGSPDDLSSGGGVNACADCRSEADHD